MDIYETSDGRFLIARWDERNAQFTTTHVKDEVREANTGFWYTYARSVDGLAPYAILYSTLAAARRALAKLDL
jgi:hypothetical protein